MGDGSMFRIRGRADGRRIDAKVFADRIEFHKPKFVGTYLSDTIRYAHVASVSARRGLIASTVTVETSGGRRFVMDLVPKGDAGRFIAMVNQRIDAIASGAHERPSEARDRYEPPPPALSVGAAATVSHPPPMPGGAARLAGPYARRELTFVSKVVRFFVVSGIVVVVGCVLLAGVGMYLATRLQPAPSAVVAPPSAAVATSPTTVPAPTVVAPEVTALPTVPPPPPVPEIAFEEVERVRLP